MSKTQDFWKEKSLSEMNKGEWESLCDHCGKCCLLKLQDDDAQDNEDSIYYTSIACNLYNKEEGQCADYSNRAKRVPNCVQLSKSNLSDLEWLPPSCSYKRIMEGRGLSKYHHLITGDINTIHEKKQSILGRVVLENEVDEEDQEEYIVTWPLK